MDRERRDKNQKLCVLFVLYAVKYPKMKLIPIQVECYAGTKADETPRRFFREEQPVGVPYPFCERFLPVM